MSAERSSSEKQRFISVSITPQAMAFTWIFEGASSFPSAFVKALIPPLHAEYATSQDAPTLPQTDEIWMILPDLELTICGITSFENENTDVRLFATILFNRHIT